MVDKITYTLLVFAWLTHSKLSPYIGRTKHTHDRCFCPLPLSFPGVGFLDACHIRVTSPHPHCRQAKSAAVHLSHTPWSVQSISKGRHGAESLPAVLSYPLWNALLVAADAHTQHTDKSSSNVCPQSIFSLSLNNLSQRLPYAQKVGGLLVTPCFV